MCGVLARPLVHGEDGQPFLAWTRARLGAPEASEAWCGFREVRPGRGSRRVRKTGSRCVVNTLLPPVNGLPGRRHRTDRPRARPTRGRVQPVPALRWVAEWLSARAPSSHPDAISTPADPTPARVDRKPCLGPCRGKPAFKGSCGSLWQSGGAEPAGLGDAGQASPAQLGGRAQAGISAPPSDLEPGACAAPSRAARWGAVCPLVP